MGVLLIALPFAWVAHWNVDQWGAHETFWCEDNLCSTECRSCSINIFSSMLCDYDPFTENLRLVRRGSGCLLGPGPPVLRRHYIKQVSTRSAIKT